MENKNLSLSEEIYICEIAMSEAIREEENILVWSERQKFPKKLFPIKNSMTCTCVRNP